MNPLSSNRNKLHRFLTEYLGISSADVPAFLAIICLAALAMLSNFACSSPKVAPSPHIQSTSTPTSTLAPTATLTPTPTLLSPVTLEEPEDGARLPCESDVELRWSCPDPLGEDERYRLTVRGPDPSVVQCDKSCFTLDEPPLGEYNWTVAVVRSSSGRAVSEDPGWYSFKILPSPVVHSISPTCTVRGTGVTVVVGGEDFTHSVALTIGVPLQAAFVNSSTITTTVPTTLEVGEHPVIVKDLVGQGESYAFFTVAGTPTPVPTALPSVSPPWNPATPVPTAPPGYDPNVACVVNPCAPAPQLIGPQDGKEFTVNSPIELRWEWAYCLPPEWKFAIRISETSPHSYRYEDNPKLISCENGKAVGRYRLPEDSRFRTTSGTYYWNIAVARSVGGGWERLSEYSETRFFMVVERGNGGDGNGGDGNGPCPPNC